MEEIFIWYFEQKGVDNPERFLGTGANGVKGVELNEGAEVNGGIDVNNTQPSALLTTPQTSEMAEKSEEQEVQKEETKKMLMQAVMKKMLEKASNKTQSLSDVIKMLKDKKSTKKK